MPDRPVGRAEDISSASLLVAQARGEVGERHAAEIFPRPRAHGDGPVFLLAVPDHQQVRHALQRVLADLIADLLVPQIGRDPEALICKGFPDFGRRSRPGRR